jgi:CBS domain containing-hemolysin-like protein
MILFMVILWLALVSALLIVAGVRPRRTDMSNFELKRREAAGDLAAGAAVRREAQLGDVLSMQYALKALLLVAVTAFGIATFGWATGMIAALIVALGYELIGSTPTVRRWSMRYYDRYEPQLLLCVERHKNLFRLIRSVTTHPLRRPRLGSREELEHVIQGAPNVISSDEKKMILSSLRSGTRTVREVMTPRNAIDSIAKNELLGPLVLDDLHKTGHSRFPVTHGDIDHIIGILHVQDLLTLDKKRSVTAEKAMHPRACYIREDQSLQDALAAFLRSRHTLLVVVNELQETVGLVCLEDVVEAMLGRKIIDEFDAHDDLRAVAARSSRDSSHSEKHEDA